MRGATLTQPRGSPPAPPSPGKSPAEQRCHAPSPSPKLARMEIAALPVDEDQRLAALRRYAILDTPPEASFDQLTRFASQLCNTPIALVSLIDRDRQWFKSRVGLDVPETPRDIAFCTHAILQPDIFEVQDAAHDPRFHDNPLVTGNPDIRFYAGAPLIDPGGKALGTLCVIDRVPRSLTPLQRDGLRVLSRAVTDQIALQQWIRELAAAGVELTAARDQARAATRAKDIFLANMSHELRTPLNTILGLSDLLREQQPAASEQRADLDTVHDAGRHLLAVIEDILAYAQLELDQPQLRLQAFNLSELVREVEAAMRVQLRDRPVALRVLRPADAPIFSDPTRVRQIAYNLVGNALKFTEQGEVTVTLEPAADGYRLHVRDTGIGIAPDKLPLLFRDFSQVHAGPTGGTGLGLAISRRYARLLGGDILAESDPGRGSVFTLELPLRPPVPADSP